MDRDFASLSRAPNVHSGEAVWHLEALSDPLDRGLFVWKPALPVGLFWGHGAFIYLRIGHIENKWLCDRSPFLSTA